MARTNKKKMRVGKALQQKAKKIRGTVKFQYPKRKTSLEQGKELGFVVAKENPLGHIYHWFQRGRKVCWETRLRVDPDGYRYIKTPNGGSQMVEIPMSGWVRKQMMRSMKAGR